MRLIDADALLNSGFPTIYHTEFGDQVINTDDIRNAPTVEQRIEYGTDGKPYILSISNGSEYSLPTGEWIPVSTREMTEEEAKELLDDFGLKDFYDNPESYWQYNCRLPDDGQEVIISTKWGVKMTTFYYDVDYGNYFEEYEDRYDVDAWMPLPEQYKKGAEE